MHATFRRVGSTQLRLREWAIASGVSKRRSADTDDAIVAGSSDVIPAVDLPTRAGTRGTHTTSGEGWRSRS
jgi:hypothetical protein